MGLDESTRESTQAAKITEERRAPVVQLVVIGAITSVVGIAIGLIIDWFPVQASGEAKQVDTLWDVLIIVSVPVFVLVETVVLYSVWKFRMRPGEEEKDGPPIHGNTRLEIIWTAIPALLLVSLCTYAYVVLRDIEDAKANTMQVRVVGEQFTWTFYYPGEGGKEVVSNQLYLPNNTPVKFNVQSKDVIHDFWVPAFRQKIDAVPGITTSYRVTTEREGEFPIVCAELCGLGHSVMRQTAHVVPRGEFDRWLAEKREGDQPGDGPPGDSGQPVDGKTLFTQTEPACGSCHTLADAGTNATIGPNLDEVLRGKDAEFIRQSIVDPSAEVASGFQDGIMPPNYDETLDPREIDALVDYLVTATGG